jgi:DNA-binding transcriptional ArsR family regulator
MSALKQTQAALRAIAEPRRMSILKLVRTRELRAGEIARHFRTTRSAISQHLPVLTRAGLLHERRQVRAGSTACDRRDSLSFRHF